MILAIDIGNTQTLFAVFDGEICVGQWRLASDARRSADEFTIWLEQFLTRIDCSASECDQVVISCVVPQSLFAIMQAIKQLCQCDPLQITSEVMQQIGLKIDVPQPNEIGADRLINALAAWDEVGGAAVVVDFGTATTFDVVSAGGSYSGGVICPGVNLSLEALHQAAAQLPNIGIETPKNAIGTNTIDAMKSGIYFGYLGLIERVLSEIQKELNESQLTVLATGGLGSLFAPATAMIHRYEPDLTMNGLRLTAQRYWKV